MKAYGKSILRSFFHSGRRFFAIFAIVALGAGFFAGMSSAAPQMRSTVDGYLDQQNTMDVELLSTLGFSEQDVQAVQKSQGVQAATPSYVEDVMSRIGESDVSVRVHALPQNGANVMNRPVLISGRWPKNGQECVLDSQRLMPISLGDSITLQEQNGQKNLKYTKLKVVGLIQSPLYVSFSLGTTNIGNGQLGHYLYVLPQTFSSSAYSCMYVTAKNAKEVSAFTEDYQTKVSAVCSTLTSLGKTRAPLRRSEVTASAQKKLDASRKTYETQKMDAQKQLASAQKKLTTAETQIAANEKKLAEARRQTAAGEKQLTQAKTQYQQGLTEYTAQKKQAESRFTAAEEQLRSGREALAQAQQKLMASRAELTSQEAKLSDAKTELAAQKQKLTAAQTQLEQSRQKLKGASTAVEQARAALAQLETAGQGASTEAAALREQIEAYDKGTQQLAASEKELNENREKWQRAQEQYEKQAAAAQPKLQAAHKKLAEGETQISAQKAKLASGGTAYQSQKQRTEQQLAEAAQKLSAAKTQIQRNTQKLAAAKAETEAGQKKLNAASVEVRKNRAAFEKSRTQTQEKLAAAEKQLTNGEQQLRQVKMPVWYVLDRDKNVGFHSFTLDADRMQSISRLFPAFFFLVAALVVLTTMTRMVEEERIEIGAYKAMGFSERSIARRYLLYALLVSVLGSVTGVVIGCLTLPPVCWNAYRIMYSAPPMTAHVVPFYALIGCLLAVGVTLLSTWGACRAVLCEKTAALLQPKAPKPGRRILLERLTPLWKHMNFTAKVTARNLFRYKKRLIMTVVGIAGCTGLILTGFGIRDSVRHVVYDQYYSVNQYNTVISLQDGGLSTGAKRIMQDSSQFQKWMLYTNRSVDISNPSGTSMTGNLMVPQNAAGLQKFVHLRDRRTHAPVAFGSNSVVVTEKLADRLGLRVGGHVVVPDGSGKRRTFTVTGITENYIYHYVYIAPAVYQKVTGETPKTNGVWASTVQPQSAHETLSRKLTQQSGVQTVAFLDDITATFDNMIRALDVIVLVLILCAGMLSFVVLYNLTNINITERTREMATLRVLGFYERESAAYIYRETTVLTALGCIGGLFLGVLMHHAVIATVEIDMCMFPRTIDPLSYLWSVLLTAAFTAAVDLLMYPRFQKINMVESLKSVD